MRRAPITAITAVVLITTLSTASSGEAPSEATKKLPPEIAQFYKAYNFVSAFSAADERRLLASSTTRKELFDRFKSPRLEEIDRALKIVNARIMYTDPGIVSPKLPLEQQIVPSGLIEVTQVRFCKSDLAIEFTAYAIGAATGVLISQYEKDKNKIPPDDQIIKKFGAPMPVKEIHKWLLVDGQWMKQDVDIVLLEAKTAILGDPSSPTDNCLPNRDRGK